MIDILVKPECPLCARALYDFSTLPHRDVSMQRVQACACMPRAVSAQSQTIEAPYPSAYWRSEAICSLFSSSLVVPCLSLVISLVLVVLTHLSLSLIIPSHLFFTLTLLFSLHFVSQTLFLIVSLSSWLFHLSYPASHSLSILLYLTHCRSLTLVISPSQAICCLSHVTSGSLSHSFSLSLVLSLTLILSVSRSPSLSPPLTSLSLSLSGRAKLLCSMCMRG